jgi:hypothetical protein
VRSFHRMGSQFSPNEAGARESLRIHCVPYALPSHVLSATRRGGLKENEIVLGERLAGWKLAKEPNSLALPDMGLDAPEMALIVG